jgi:hypothetical protein
MARMARMMARKRMTRCELQEVERQGARVTAQRPPGHAGQTPLDKRRAIRELRGRREEKHVGSLDMVLNTLTTLNPLALTEDPA